VQYGTSSSIHKVVYSAGGLHDAQPVIGGDTETGTDLRLQCSVCENSDDDDASTRVSKKD